jgi:head-tail adaptor
MVLTSGSLRNYVAIQAATRTSDGQGGWTVTWATVVSEWASAKPLSMSRALDQSGIKYKSAVEFGMRKRDDTPADLYTLTGEHRIVWNSQNYTIHSVVPNEVLSELKILAYV